VEHYVTEREKKTCTSVHIGEVMVARGTVKEAFMFRIESCSQQRGAFPAKIAPSDLRVFRIRRCSLTEVLLYIFF
jgi:hypothetical protein